MIKLFQPYMPADVDAPLLDTLHSGYITQGEKVEEFERLWGEFIGNPLAVSVNSGTSALTLAMRLAGVGPGDEVITTPMTCSATNLPILSLGATPVFADIDAKTGLIDPQSVKRAITKKTKAIVCVDWGGMPCDLDALSDLARKHNLKLIEDAAHAIGAEYKGKKVGNQADFTCFSFQAIKHITTIDGGMVMLKDKADYDRAKLLRWFGISRDSNSKDTRIDEDIAEWGYKFHMNDVNATIGIAQMKHVAQVVAAYRANAHYYHRSLPAEITLPKDTTTRSSYWLYTLVFPNKVMRDEFKDYMAEHKIQVSQVHRRNDGYSVFKPFVERYVPEYNKTITTTDLPNTRAFANTMVCIPVHWALETKDLTAISRIINNFVNEYRSYL
jgi:perosamine synthetase